MTHRPTSAKSLRQNIKRRAGNRTAISRLRTQLKKFAKATEAGNTAAAREELRITVKALDQAAAKSLIKKGTVSRYKSRLTKRLNKLSGAGKETSKAAE
ncbi:MAG: 30S ribosomal protein S20 [Planctomycetes bacterium RIFCSPHIGHO2_02_FULL_50_42]|nr:MAG: 30S ribosomal protein S20 [Planctomycetes bacterium GWA2_50_13]OHB88016.1 MAG: 30S ribosomal protein S20 [Planctomycetes bacterium RIFCSPHIGHO2_02_FULL_50_42]OHB96170.1 MAG: 30S ribosomal protein S20 [Planctomycetes bacterium RIFCSPLOWO2_02_FULL_50_16]OHC04714.1 MAG: 30S ribosomal protein S20 [Planctomycetes bacterium RIFCSPLOWO2_12_FULL_50_35]HCN19171.1 30S ribosomal protein S20 [Planctomycetia bacterium]